MAVKAISMEEQKKRGKMLLTFGVILWIIGFVMILSAIYSEFWGSYVGTPDSESSKYLITLKLGGIGLTLGGIFLSLVVIVKVLMMMPMKLAEQIKKR